MRFYVISVLPEIFPSFLEHGLVGKAIASDKIAVETITPREFARDRHRTVDDAPYGGGSGMVMMPAPLIAAMDDAERRCAEAGAGRPLRVLLTPQGEPLTQARARALTQQSALTLICGRYEGVDERARRRCDLEISLGDFVLMGGEVGAMALIEAVSRLLPGVLGNAASIEEESHAQGLLEYPHYTRPADLDGELVPEVLSSGNHAAIARWRRTEALRRTRDRRPDMLAAATLDASDLAALEALRREETT